MVGICVYIEDSGTEQLLLLISSSHTTFKSLLHYLRIRYLCKNQFSLRSIFCSRVQDLVSLPGSLSSTQHQTRNTSSTANFKTYLHSITMCHAYKTAFLYKHKHGIMYEKCKNGCQNRVSFPLSHDENCEIHKMPPKYVDNHKRCSKTKINGHYKETILYLRCIHDDQDPTLPSVKHIWTAPE